MLSRARIAIPVFVVGTGLAAFGVVLVGVSGMIKGEQALTSTSSMTAATKRVRQVREVMAAPVFIVGTGLFFLGMGLLNGSQMIGGWEDAPGTPRAR